VSADNFDRMPANLASAQLTVRAVSIYYNSSVTWHLGVVGRFDNNKDDDNFKQKL